MKITARGVSGSTITAFSVSSFNNEEGDKVIKDSTLTQGITDLSYVLSYRLPAYETDTLPVRFTARATASNGTEVESTCRLVVIKADHLLKELSSITLYSKEAETHPNGYSLSRSTAIHTSFSDSADIDIATVLGEDETILTRRWSTNAKLYFVRANGFDYSKASYVNVRNVYRSSVPYHVIDNIQNDDIIIVGNSTDALAIIKVVAVYDEPEVMNDRYLISIKKVE